MIDPANKEYTTYYITNAETAVQFAERHHTEYSATEYLIPTISAEGRKTVVKRALEHLQHVDFDSIAFTGMSGALLAPTLAYVLDKELIAVRKPDSATHSFHKIEGPKHPKRYVIVDDFICSGGTMEGIIMRVKQFAPNAECVGVYEYYYGGFRTLDRLKELSVYVPTEEIGG